MHEKICTFAQSDVTREAMLTYCPTCANMLLIEKASNGDLRYYCQTCPYTYRIDRKISVSKDVKHREDMGIQTEEQALATMQKTAAQCKKCGHGEAYFREQQTRSADEPATLYFICCACKAKWNE